MVRVGGNIMGDACGRPQRMRVTVWSQRYRMVCLKGARAGANGQAPVPAEPFADEAARFTKRLVLQREVLFDTTYNIKFS